MRHSEKEMGKDGQVGYLHGGSARNLTEAVLWHDGEVATSRGHVENLAKSDRAALPAFSRSL